MTETISVTEARAKLAEYTIVKHGKARVVLVSADEYEGLIETLDTLSNSAAVTRIQRSLAELARGETLDFEEVTGEPL